MLARGWAPAAWAGRHRLRHRPAGPPRAPPQMPRRRGRRRGARRMPLAQRPAAGPRRAPVRPRLPRCPLPEPPRPPTARPPRHPCRWAPGPLLRAPSRPRLAAGPPQPGARPRKPPRRARQPPGAVAPMPTPPLELRTWHASGSPPPLPPRLSAGKQTSRKAHFPNCARTARAPRRTTCRDIASRHLRQSRRRLCRPLLVCRPHPREPRLQRRHGRPQRRCLLLELPHPRPVHVRHPRSHGIAKGLRPQSCSDRAHTLGTQAVEGRRARRVPPHSGVPLGPD